MEKRELGKLTPEQKEVFLAELKAEGLHILKLGQRYLEVTAEKSTTIGHDSTFRGFHHPTIYGTLTQANGGKKVPFTVSIIDYQLRSLGPHPNETIERAYQKITGPAE